MLISHSQDFLNGICTNIIHMHNRKLKYYTVSGCAANKNGDAVLSSGVCLMFCGPSLQGNYDQYVKTRLELEENQMKRFHWEQDQIAHMKVSAHLHEHLSARACRQPCTTSAFLSWLLANFLFCCRIILHDLVTVVQSWPGKLRARRRLFKK